MPRLSTFMLSGTPGLELGQLEQRFHQHDRIDAAALRLEHEPHVLGRLVAHVGEQRQLLLQQQLGDAGDQPRLRDLIGNLGDDDLIGAAAGVFLRPSARADGSCRARSCRPARSRRAARR